MFDFQDREPRPQKWHTTHIQSRKNCCVRKDIIYHFVYLVNKLSFCWRLIGTMWHPKIAETYSMNDNDICIYFSDTVYSSYLINCLTNGTSSIWSSIKIEAVHLDWTLPLLIVTGFRVLVLPYIHGCSDVCTGKLITMRPSESTVFNLPTEDRGYITSAMMPCLRRGLILLKQYWHNSLMKNEICNIVK